MERQQPNIPQGLTQVSAAAFAAKFQSKRGKSHYSDSTHLPLESPIRFMLV
jgi:hypothetical protein